MLKKPVIPGVWWVEVPEVNLRMICGTPMDVVKHLFKLGFIKHIGKDGVFRESGPNAILLSDKPVQGGRFWNLAEFPFLHMLYRQGMGIPGHPGNDGSKPIITGSAERCDGVISYIQRGTYGLLSREEMTASGVPPGDLEDLWRMKVKFAGGAVKSPQDLIDMVPVGTDSTVLKKGVTICRTSPNVFLLSHESGELTIDMNLPPGEDWIPSYQLPPVNPEEGGFSVIHIGEGNGWDPDRPCMGSIVVHRGSRYLIDSGPGIDYSLKALGLDLADIDGMFFTHVHDDHFAGLTSLLRGDRKVTVYATRPVMATVRLKFSALLEKDPSYIDELIDVRYLAEDEWNDVDGMTVRPTTSPHPLETTIMFFRSALGDGYRSYAHLADISSYAVLESFTGENGISEKFVKRVKAEYSTYADLKKIDVGGGMIHGLAGDFVGDNSKRLVLSHTVGPLKADQKAIGDGVEFGAVDILIPDSGNSLKERGAVLLDRSFHGLGRDDSIMVEESHVRTFSTGDKLLEKGKHVDSLYLVVRGLVVSRKSDSEVLYRFSNGGIVGEEEVLQHRPVENEYSAFGPVTVLELKAESYLKALKRHGGIKKRITVLERREHLIEASPLVESVGNPRLVDLAAAAKERTWKNGRSVRSGRDEVYLIRQGKVLRENDEAMGPGTWLNISGVLKYSDSNESSSWKVEESTNVLTIPGNLIRETPVLAWLLADYHPQQ